MEYQSNKHGPREDEDLKHAVNSLVHGAPVESRAQQNRLEEDPGPDIEIDAGSRPDIPVRGGLSPEEAELRAELAARTASAHFPADRAELLRAAEYDGRDERVLAMLHRLPESKHFDNIEAVWLVLGGHREERP